MKKAILMISSSLLLSGCYSSLQSDEEMKEKYLKNKNELVKIEGICRKHVSLVGIRSGFLDLKITPENLKTKLSSSDKDVILRIFKDTAASQIRCSWSYKREVGWLDSVAFDFIGTFGGISNEMKTLMQNIDLPPEFVKDRVTRGELREIGVDGWYIYEVK